MSGADLDGQLTQFAEHLIARAKETDTKLDDAVKVFREVREFYSLTRPAEAGDKPVGRRSTMSSMRKRVEAARGSENGRADPALQDAVDRA